MWYLLEPRAPALEEDAGCSAQSRVASVKAWPQGSQSLLQEPEARLLALLSPKRHKHKIYWGKIYETKSVSSEKIILPAIPSTFQESTTRHHLDEMCESQSK